MNFVGKSKRMAQEKKEPILAQTYTKEKSKTQYVATSASEKQIEIIQKQYTTDKTKSYRNLTNPSSIDWSYKEDTYKEFNDPYQISKLLKQENNEKDENENEFEKPSKKIIVIDKKEENKPNDKEKKTKESSDRKEIIEKDKK